MIMLIVILPICAANSTQMCVSDDVIAVVLDKDVAGTDRSYNATYNTWETYFPYGTVRGISACTNTSGSYSVANENLDVSESGLYCWCKMTSPAVSLWVFRYSLGSASECASACALYCGNRVRDHSDFRAGLFGSVAR